jgi:aminoglycoside 2'-N-acetyltransferase I
MPNAKVFTTRTALGSQLKNIRRLLDEAFGGDFSDEDWEHTLGGWHVVLVERGVPLAHAAVVPRVLTVAGDPLRSGYVEGVATTPQRQGEGFGWAVMSRVGQVLHDEFEIGALSTNFHGFYKRLGWERWRGPTFVRHGGELIRTEEEDDGIMVLRFGTSVELDLTAPISCAARNGDDW